jgi:hypothetical protein
VRGGLVSFAVAAVLCAAQLGASCVDGVTPDCSNTSECGPISLDAAGEGSTLIAADAADAADTSDAADAADAPSEANELEAGDAADGG